LTKTNHTKDLMNLVDKIKVMGVRTNAETLTAAQGAKFGAEGIGLFRTEHMFYGEGSEQPLFLLRKMIVSKTKKNAGRA
jgi:pyruvate,orthophosphate dikinase